MSTEPLNITLVERLTGAQFENLCGFYGSRLDELDNCIRIFLLYIVKIIYSKSSN